MKNAEKSLLFENGLEVALKSAMKKPKIDKPKSQQKKLEHFLDKNESK